MTAHTARDLSAMLARNVEAVAVHLLGHAGQRSGQELCYADLTGQPGKSLRIHLTGDKAGVWSDFATGETGDLVDLWALKHQCDIGQALHDIRRYLGVSPVKLTGRQMTAHTIPKPDKLHNLHGAELHWLREHRKLSPEAIAAYKLVTRKDGVIAFPYLLPDGALAALKYRTIHKDHYWAEKDGSKILFGWQAIPPTARSVVLCEGELKALAWWDYGYPALSVPFGGGAKAKQGWIETEYDRLQRFDLIYLAMDEDAAGKEAATEILNRLGPERCAIVQHPLPAEPDAKCINACVRHGISRAAIASSIEKAQPRDPEELRSAADYASEVVDLLAAHNHQQGLRTPWKKIGEQLLFRPGELTVIAGINGHGKSQLVGFMAAHAMRNGARVCMASLEFKVAGWLARLCRQIGAQPNPTPGFTQHIVQWLGEGRLWIYDAQGTAKWPRMLDVFRYAHRRYGIELFIIDNLTGLGIGEEDMQGQKEAALAFANFARDEQCHIWLVHHIRKGASEHEAPGKMDIKGSGAITDLASTVLTVWRNKEKEIARANAEAGGPAMDSKLEQSADVKVFCSKQRNYTGTGNGEPSIALWWDAASFHYLENEHSRPRDILPSDARYFDKPVVAAARNAHADAVFEDEHPMTN